MSETIQPVETIEAKRRREIEAEWEQKRLGGMSQEAASAGTIADLIQDGYNLGLMGISLNTPADVAEKKIAEYKAVHQTPGQT